ncbi:MAG: helix-turn-helix transcriptional regulator [Anaerolineales bacterium]|nr:helix-turn-helix transcriptional regulator [Anaerolineales bacterium]
MSPDATGNPSFGQRVLALRRAKRWSQGELVKALAGRKVKIDVTYLSKIENNRLDSPPAADTIRALAAALEADPEELLDLAGRYDQQALQQVARDIPEAAALLRRLGQRQISAKQIRTFLKATDQETGDDADPE